MRRLLLIVAALVVLLVGAGLVALLTLDPNQFREPIAAQASAALGRPVALGAIELDLFPLPGLRIDDVQVGGRPGEPTFAKVDSLRLGISPLSLLAGRVVLRSVEVERPRIELVLNKKGRFEVPDFGSPPSAEGPGETAAPAAEGAPAVLIQRFEVRDGELTAGEWKATDIGIAGSLELGRGLRLELEADLEGVGTLREVEVETSGTGSDQRIDVAGEVGGLALAALAQRFAPEIALAGTADGTLRASFRGGQLDGGSLDLQSRELRLRQGDLEILGDVPIQAELEKRFGMELSGAAVRCGTLLAKPPGERLRIHGSLGRELPPTRLRQVHLELPDGELRLDVEMTDATRLSVAPATLPLAGVGRWLALDGRSVSGRAVLDVVELDLAPLALRGPVRLEPLAIGLADGGALELRGKLEGRGARVHWDDLALVTSGQTARTKGSYALASGRLQLVAKTDGFELAPVVEAFTGKRVLVGALVSNLELEGPAELAALRGRGSFEVAPGRIEGFSLIRALLGELSKIPVAVAHMKGRDLSRYAREDFQRLAGDFRIEGGKALLEPLTLEYEHASAKLRGDIALETGELSLAGEIVLSDAVDAELAGAKQGRRRVIPIHGISGTVQSPRISVDRTVVAQLITSYAARDLGRRLEERVGPGAGEAIGGILEELLRGAPERR